MAADDWTLVFRHLVTERYRTRAAFMRASGVSQSTVERWWNGQSHPREAQLAMARRAIPDLPDPVPPRTSEELKQLERRLADLEEAVVTLAWHARRARGDEAIDVDEVLRRLGVDPEQLDAEGALSEADEALRGDGRGDDEPEDEEPGQRPRTG